MGLKPPTRPCWGGVFLLSAILLFPGPSSIWSWDLQNKFGLEDPGGMCVPIGRGWWWWWLSFLLLFTIDYIITPVRVYQFLLLSSSIGLIDYCWLVSDFYFYYCHDSDLFQHDEKFQNDERTMFFDMLPYVCLSDWLPIIIWALSHCSRIFSRAGESSECARPNPQWEWKGAPHNAALPGTSRPLTSTPSIDHHGLPVVDHGDQTVVVGKNP